MYRSTEGCTGARIDVPEYERAYRNTEGCIGEQIDVSEYVRMGNVPE